MMVVYLAGGMRSGWQDKVKEALPDVLFIDPRDHGFTEERLYTAWDMLGVDWCNVVFMYIEKDNPSGANAIYEAGKARGQGKCVIFVDEKQDKYQRLPAEDAQFYTTNFEEGIKILRKLDPIYNWVNKGS
jgi:hypothetical protein